ncbi:MAG TPA: trypsin-like peptidase domain-containing protein [Cyclobacteriaceae bacterium]|nr:trypsin-like peptidase domain-containing protein [Cyclobacteriaceae bacterium]
MRNTFKIIVTGFLAGLAGAYTFTHFQKSETPAGEPRADYTVSHYVPDETYKANVVMPSATTNLENVDFSMAAAKAIPSVVYINSISQSGPSYSYWEFLLGGGSGSQTQVSSGSGVIFTSDGYIITNNHVVESAEKIQVIHNKKVYDAELIGTDPSTDLAVLKIKEINLPAVTLGNSKTLAVGEWVVAVGNPLSLASTVTAGIVSAKGRRINILEDKFPIESFIQTDAAINPGNSGGALVNKNGDLVGINTAIISRTGSYTGYAFAVPVDIAKKVVNDLIKFGIVQKAFLGGNVIEYDFQTATKYDLDATVKEFKGVVLAELDKSGAARTSGLKLGDIIVKIDDAEINSKSEFEESLSYHYPGDKINISFIRGGKTMTTTIALVNKNGDTNFIKRKIYSDASLGVNLEQVDYGVKVYKIKDGLFKNLGIPENYTIISINRGRIKDPQEVIDFFHQYKGRVLLYGINSSKQEMPLQFVLQ